MIYYSTLKFKNSVFKNIVVDCQTKTTIVINLYRLHLLNYEL